MNDNLGDEKGNNTMTQSVYEQANEQIADTVHKASRAASAAWKPSKMAWERHGVLQSTAAMRP